MTADDAQASGQAREVEVVARAAGLEPDCLGGPTHDEIIAALVEQYAAQVREEMVSDDGYLADPERVLLLIEKVRAAERQEAAREAWDEGYETGRDDECFDQRGLSTNSDAHEYPHANPYRADGVTGRSGT